MKPITYRGYQASVEYEDGSLFIKILHIDDLLVAECESAAQVETCARSLIDDYIATCAELGRDPQKPFKGSFNVRMEPDLHRKAAMAAADLSMSLNSWICMAVTEKLDCNGIAERFDGVFSKKRQEMSVASTVQLLQAQQSITFVDYFQHVYPQTKDNPQFSYVGDSEVLGRFDRGLKSVSKAKFNA